MERTTGKFQINHIYLDFILALSNLSEAKHILLLTGIIDPADLPREIQDKIVSVSLSEDPASALQGEVSFDLAIIVPNFGRYGGIHEFPRSWNLSSASAKQNSEDAWLAWAIQATRPDGMIFALTSQGMLTSSLREPVRQCVIREGLETVISLGKTFHPATSVSASLLIIRRSHNPKEISFVDMSDVTEDADWVSIASSIKDTRLSNVDIQGFWATTVNRDSLLGQSRLDPYFYHPKFLRIEPPEGYIEFLLSDIGEIRGGRSLASFKSQAESEGVQIPFIQVGNITPEGSLSVEWAKSFPKMPEEISRAGYACPGDILITVAGTLGKVCLVPDDYVNGLYYDTSVRRLRVDQDIVSPVAVYEFLNSEIARVQVERYASGSVIPIISSIDLSNIRIFLPNSEIKDLDEIGEMVEIPKLPPKKLHQVIADMLVNQVVNSLRSVEDQERQEWRENAVTNLRQIMQQIQKDHEPLDELVTREYPLPIALAYRRMIRAEHNPYEQVGRLIGLYESLTQFFYYVLLSDYLKNPALQRVYHPNDKGVRGAYKSYSMDKRLKFVDGLLKTIKRQAGKDSNLRPFIPELLGVDLCAPLDKLRCLRNEDSHSAAGTTAAQRAILEENIPLAEHLLNEVRFLREYPLCRVQGSYAQQGKVILTIEYFQGALYETDIREQEAPIAEDEQPKQITADREHVVLLNSQFDWLDLHPFYQVITSKEYRYEAHLCFHKQVITDEAGQRQIHGESIQFRREFPLPGIQDLDRLVTLAKL